MATSEALAKLEFNEILKRLSTHCHYSLAATRAMEIGPSRDRKIVRYLLDVTAEAADFRVRYPEFTVGGARDIRASIAKAEKGGRLTPNELLDVSDTLRAGRDIRRTFTRMPEGEERYPNLLEFAEAMENFSPLETDLTRSIGPRGDVLDSASDELARIRKAVRIAHHRLMDRLNSFLSGGRYGSALQENIITIRDGRYVLPVRSESRGLIRGIVHDTSSSGHTVFVEPFDVVELNNRWREEQLAETHEIERILDTLSGKIGDQAEAISRLIEAIAAIDLAMAKARLAEAMEATRPRLHEPPSGGGRQRDERGHPTNRVRLVNARHPLLDRNAVVPISLEIGEEFRILLITGPNTGGKTVALKTVGLLTLMAQTGLFLPADDTSITSVFDSVFVDIGDEQSIEQSLSTFSSHIRNIVGMLGKVGSNSLVLLDEVGAGTDPQEGSALARALMSALLERKAMVIATTHYSEVKGFAYATPGVENASVEFDLETLSPTYRLMIGIPGRSNALSIARRLGMPSSIIDEAEGLLEPGDERAEELIDQIRQRRDDITAQLRAAEQAEEEARVLRRRAAQSIREADEVKRTAREDAIAEVEAELQEARQAIRELERRTRGASPVTRSERATSQEAINTAERELRLAQKRKRPIPVPAATQQKRSLRAGDTVRIISLDQKGEVISVDGGDAEVQMGALKIRQPVTNLERIGRSERKGSSQRFVAAPNDSVSIEIDLRGHRAEEIAPILETYIHDAYLTGLPWVRIIHGKGTGALRQVVRDELKDNPVVERFVAAEANEGGEGATVAHLRKG